MLLLLLSWPYVAGCTFTSGNRERELSFLVLLQLAETKT